MKTLRLFSLAALLVFITSPNVLGQTAEETFDWETLRPAAEEFSVSMPKEPAFESGKMPYHKMELNTRLYLSKSAAGPVFAVVSMSGIKSNPALYTELERLNSYVDAFKKFLAPKLKKDAIAKLTFTSNKTLNGHTGREYQMSIADLSGTARVFGTRKRFYAVVFLDNKKSDKIKEQFLSTFTLPEKVVETPQTVAAQAPGKPEVEIQSTDVGSEVKPDPNRPDANKADIKPAPEGAPAETDTKGTETKSPETKPPDGARKPIHGGPIHGGVLNGKALSLPKPYYPAEARAAKVGGTVSIQVTIDEYGTVIAAQALNGHPLLQQASINAAYMARFSPTTLMGEPVKVTGVIVYNFVAQ